MLRRANDKATQNIDRCDEQTRDGIASYKLRGTVHGPIEIRLAGDVFSPNAGVFVTKQAGVEIRVDSHLLTGHGIESEARGDL